MPLSYVIAIDNAPPYVRAQENDGVAGRGDGGRGSVVYQRRHPQHAATSQHDIDTDIVVRELHQEKVAIVSYSMQYVPGTRVLVCNTCIMARKGSKT